MASVGEEGSRMSESESESSSLGWAVRVIAKIEKMAVEMIVRRDLPDQLIRVVGWL